MGGGLIMNEGVSDDAVYRKALAIWSIILATMQPAVAGTIQILQAYVCVLNHEAVWFWYIIWALIW